MKLRILSVMAVLGILMAASPAFAISLDDALAKGLIAERNDGYISVIKGTHEVLALAENENNRRRQEYNRIAQETHQRVDVVGAHAAEQIAAQLRQGMHYQDARGNWVIHP